MIQEKTVLRLFMLFLAAGCIGCMRSSRVTARMEVENELIQYPDASISCGRKFNAKSWGCVILLDHGWTKSKLFGWSFRTYHRYVFNFMFQIPSRSVRNLRDLVGKK